MYMFVGGMGALFGIVWLWHSIAAVGGMSTIPDITSALYDPNQASLPRLSIIVPARDEEGMIGAAVKSLLSLKYTELEIVVVDDRSSDSTGTILDEIAEEVDERLRVIHIRELPLGWLGKTHAMHVGVQNSSGEWILFTDADVVHRKDGLSRAIQFAERTKADHLVVLPTVVMESWGERMMIALFQSLFMFAHRPWKVADPKAKDHIGMGAFNLIRASVYRQIGGYERLKLAVIDDIRLGALVKRAGFAQRVVLGPDLVRVRWAHGLLGVVRNTQKNFFAEFGYDPLLATGAVIGVLLLQLGPWIGTIFAPDWAKLGFAVALACAFIAYTGGSVRIVPRWYFVVHPLATVLLAYAILRSMFLTLIQGGVVWRGTKYPLAELRRAMGD